MRALLIQTGSVEIRDVPYDIFSVERILSAKNVEIITLPDGIMYGAIEAEEEGKPRNDLASLIARREVYGPALIAGFGNDDVPQSYIDAYMV